MDKYLKKLKEDNNQGLANYLDNILDGSKELNTTLPNYNRIKIKHFNHLMSASASSVNAYDLDAKMNQWLDTHPNITIVDIIYRIRPITHTILTQAFIHYIEN